MSPSNRDPRKAIATLCVVGAAFGLLRVLGPTRSSICVDPPFVSYGSAAAERQTRYPLRVVTLNLAEETELDNVLTLFAPAPDLPEPDIYLLQEVIHRPGAEDDLLAAIANKFGVQVIFASATEKRLDESLEGLAIVSRYPLTDVEALPLQRFGLHTRSRCRVALVATVDLGEHAVRVANVHLDTRINANKRLEQLSPVFEQVKSFAGPTIVAGDLNTNNMFWLEHLVPIPFMQNQAEKVREQFQALGFSSPQPLDGPITLPIAQQRLDWLYVRDLNVEQWGVKQIEFSDHRAVWMTVRVG